MRHLVTISLVFFSLSHLAKVDRMDAMRYMSQRYSDKQTTASTQLVVSQNQDNQDTPQLLLSNKQLSVIGVLPAPNCSKYRLENQISNYSVALEHPRNNSP